MNFTRNLDQDKNTTMFFIIEGVKETMLNFSEGTMKVFCFSVIRNGSIQHFKCKII